MISDLNRSLGSRYFLYVVSRLNEISGGFEKIVLVSESFWSNLKFLRMTDLTAWLYVRVKCKSKWNPSHVKNSIPFSQFLRLLRLCSDDSGYFEKTRGNVPFVR